MSKLTVIRKATHEGELPLGESSISCAVLDDGTRILAAAAVFKALERPRKGKQSESSRADQMPSFLDANNLQPFINEDVKQWTELVQYQGLNGTMKTGYNAKLLRVICKVYLDARKDKKLLKTQEKTAEVAEKILYALADIGIESLVDRATGFEQEKIKTKNKLELFLKQFMREDAAQLVKRFEDSFFEMIYKMRGWTWNYTHKHPGVVGVWINDIVYERVAPLVLAELKKKNPITDKGVRAKKHHQYLSEEIGVPKLLNHLAAVEALGRASSYDWNKFMVMLDTAFPKQYQSIKLLLPFPDEEIKTIELPKPKTEFDEKLTQALNYNPKEEKK